jgi:hypothetical protein
LLYGVTLALPFIAVRLAYAVASFVLELDHPTSSFLTSLPIKVCLSVVPEVIVVLVLVVAGIATLNVNKALVEGMREDYILADSQLQVTMVGNKSLP